MPQGADSGTKLGGIDGGLVVPGSDAGTRPGYDASKERFGFQEVVGPGMFRLASVRADGTDYQPAAMPPQSIAIQGAWSRDGRRVAYSVQVGSTVEYQLFVMNADGTDHRYLADGRDPCWSNDGNRLAFVRFHRDGVRSWATLHGHDMITGTGVFSGTAPLPGLVLNGRVADIRNMSRPLWRGRDEVIVSYYESDLMTASVFYCLYLYREVGPPTALLSSPDRVSTLIDVSPRDGYALYQRTRAPNVPSGVDLYGLENGQSTGPIVANGEVFGWFSPDGSRTRSNRLGGMQYFDARLGGPGTPGVFPSQGIHSWYLGT